MNPSAPRFLDLPDGAEIPLPASEAFSASVHVIDRPSVLAINAALAAERPLLVRGEPGTGKSQLARAAARALGRRFAWCAIDARTESRDLMYVVDTVARLAEAQVVGALRIGDAAPAVAAQRMQPQRFVHPGPLWWVFDPSGAATQAAEAKCAPLAWEQPEGWSFERGVVVLLDEIDKADVSVPNGLLDALGQQHFHVPDVGTVSRAEGPAPLVMLTTNEERSLPDAFLRRCLVLRLAVDEGDDERLAAWLTRHARPHFPNADPTLLAEAAKLLISDRAKHRHAGRTPPGLAEHLDLLRAVTGQPGTPEQQITLLRQVATFALKKHPESPA